MNSHLLFFDDLLVSWTALLLITREEEEEDMEHHQALPSSDLTMTANDSNNNNSMHYHHSNRRKRRTTKQQQFASSTSTSTGIRLGEKAGIFSMSITDDQLLPLKRPLSWTKRWSKWFSACSADHQRSTSSPSNPMEVSVFYLLFSSVDRLHLLRRVLFGCN